MDGKIIKVVFDEWQKTQYNKGDLAQWDRGMRLDISGLDISGETVEVHFSLEEVSGDAVRRVGTVENGVISVKIPAFILEGPEYIYGESYCAWACVYVSDEESAETIRKICFTIGARPKPEDYVRDEEEVKLWSALEEKIEDVNKDLQSAKEKQDFVAEYGVTTYGEIKEAHERGCDVRVKYVADSTTKLEAGTYDADGNLLQTWDELIEAWKSYNSGAREDMDCTSNPANNITAAFHSDTHTAIISDKVEKIRSWSLYKSTRTVAKNVKYIVIPNSVTSLGNFQAIAFYDTVSIPNSVTEIVRDMPGMINNSLEVSTLYYTGQMIGVDGFTDATNIYPYEEAPNEAKGYIDSVEYFFGNLEVIDNNFVFYTTKDDMPLKIVCNADGWSSEEMKYAKPDDIPTKTSQLTNDSGYITKATFTGIYGQSIYEELLEAHNKGYNVVIQQDGRIYPITSQISASNTTTPYPAYMRGNKHVTISDFVDSDGNQMDANYTFTGNSDGVLECFALKDTESFFDTTTISMRVNWTEGTYKNRIDIGGNNKWTGFSIHPNEDGSRLEIRDNYGMSSETVDINMTSDIAGVSSFLNNEFLLQIGFDYVSGMGALPHLNLFIYINGVLYNNSEFTINLPDSNKRGNLLNFYSESETGQISVSDVKVEDWFDKLKFTSVQEVNGEYVIAEGVCNHAPSGETIWTGNGIQIPKDYVTNKILEQKSSVYKYDNILSGGTFNLREKGLYIFCGYDYDLNLYDASGKLTGEDNCLVIILFCTEADKNGNFSVFAMQNYKGGLLGSSIKSVVQSGLNDKAYVKNTGSNVATVFYMRQNEVETE